MSLLDSLKGEADAASWRPEPGEGIEGVITRKGTTTSDYISDEIPTLTVKAEDGTIHRVVGFHTILRREIEEADPRVGDTIAIVYHGKRDTKDGKGSYHHYGVMVQHAGGAVSQAGPMDDPAPVVPTPAPAAEDDKPPF